MIPRGRWVCLGLYATAGVLALPWVLEWALHGSFGRPPAIPRIILTTGRKHR